MKRKNADKQGFGRALLPVAFIAMLLGALASNGQAQTLQPAQQPSPQVQSEITLSPSIGVSGSTVDIDGRGFPPGFSVAVSMDDIIMASDVVAANDGTFSVSVIVPELPEGTKTVTATAFSEVDSLGIASASAPFTITALPADQIDQAVPETRGLPWRWIIPVSLAVFAAIGTGFFIKMMINKGRLAEIQVISEKDKGIQITESVTPIRLNLELRFKPVSDPGRQEIETAASSATCERGEEG